MHIHVYVTSTLSMPVRELAHMYNIYPIHISLNTHIYIYIRTHAGVVGVVGGSKEYSGGPYYASIAAIKIVINIILCIYIYIFICIY